MTAKTNGIGTSALIYGTDGEHLYGETDLEKASKVVRQEVEKRKAIRANVLRRLNAAIRTEADSIGAIRRDRRGGIRTEHPETTPDRRPPLPGSTADRATCASAQETASHLASNSLLESACAPG